MSLPMPCAGCDEPTPYEASRENGPPETSYGEFLSTPLGDVYVRTHRRRECVVAARDRMSGRPTHRRTVREELDAEAAERAAERQRVPAGRGRLPPA